MESTILLAQQFGLDHLPEPDQKKILNDIGMIFGESLVLRSLVNLNEQDSALCNEMLQRDASIIDIINFLKEKNPDFQTIFQEEFDRIKKTLAV